MSRPPSYPFLRSVSASDRASGAQHDDPFGELLLGRGHVAGFCPVTVTWYLRWCNGSAVALPILLVPPAIKDASTGMSLKPASGSSGLGRDRR